MKTELENRSASDLKSFILMQRIFPAPEVSSLCNRGVMKTDNALCEFGFYSVFVGGASKEILNIHAGHNVRTKFDGVDEGGVATGFSCLSSPFLI